MYKYALEEHLLQSDSNCTNNFYESSCNEFHHCECGLCKKPYSTLNIDGVLNDIRNNWIKERENDNQNKQ